MFGTRRADFSAFGALLALALDLAVLAVASALVVAGESLAFGAAIAAGIGAIMAPILGWKYGPMAATAPTREWARTASRSIITLCAIVIAGWVSIQAVTVSTRDGLVGKIALVAYAVVMDTVIVVGLAFLLAALAGVPWVAGMRWYGRRRTV